MMTQASLMMISCSDGFQLSILISLRGMQVLKKSSAQLAVLFAPIQMEFLSI